MFCNAEKLSAETERNRTEYLRLGGKIVVEMPTVGVAVVVDCLLGTGFKGELKPLAKEIIDRINTLKNQGAYVLSADVPSGLNDNGRAEYAVYADETLCIGQEKLAVRLLDGLDFAGEVSTLDIGIGVLETEKTEYAVAVEKREVKEILFYYGIGKEYEM